jgi:Zn-dependent M28 family amino/carboxypeptidase
MFVWHAGEESGLLGSRYMADFPVVPLDRIQAQLNVDMIGRNRDDRASEENTLYVIGADRISTDLHNIVVDTNQTLARPLTLDFEFNDPADVHTFYTRSDHYSYASRGIPIAFFFTGTHADYHANSDSVDKILFPKLIRVAEFIYRTGFNLADSERPLERDHLGARTGKGPAGRLEKPARP